MAITGRSPRDGFAHLESHLAALVNAVVPTDAIFKALQRREEPRCLLSFVSGGPTVAPIETARGRLFLGLALWVEAVPEGSQYRLTTKSYHFRLQATADRKAHSIIRWEFDRDAESGDPHVQIAAQTRATGADAKDAFDWNRLHVPTGRVLIEHVLRFLVRDLGMEPPCGHDAWASRVDASEATYRSVFATPPPRTAGA